MMKTLRILFVALFALLFGQQISAQIFYESFDKCAGKGGNDGFFDGKKPNDDTAKTPVTADNFDNKGWAYENAYSANQCIKLGTGKKQGSATTPVLTKLTGNATLTFRAAAWNGATEKTTLNVTINGGGSLSESSFTLEKGAFTTYTINITGGTSASTVTFAAAEAANNRFFLDDVKIVSGSADVKKDAGLQFSEASIQVEKGQTFTAPTFSKKTSAAVTFTSDNEKVATVNAEGVVSLAGDEGTAVITAKAEENDEYYAGEATCKISVFTYNTYKKVTALASGNKYLLVALRNDTLNYALPLEKNETYGYLSRYYVKGASDELKVKSLYDDSFTFTANGEGYDISDYQGRYYIQKGKYNSFNTLTEVPEAHWTVTPNADGTFKIEMNGHYIQWGQGTYTTFGAWTEVQTNAVQPMLYELVSKTDGINSVAGSTVKKANAVYTISGVRLNKKVNELTKGLYIVNGKKVVVK